MNKVLLFGKNFGYSEKTEPIKEKPIFDSEKTLSQKKILGHSHENFVSTRVLTKTSKKERKLFWKIFF